MSHYHTDSHSGRSDCYWSACELTTDCLTHIQAVGRRHWPLNCQTQNYTQHRTFNREREKCLCTMHLLSILTVCTYVCVWSQCMCVSVCMCVHACVHVCACVSMCVHACACVCACVCMCACVSMCVHVCLCPSHLATGKHHKQVLHSMYLPLNTISSVP